jgi:hypothetical protein
MRIAPHIVNTDFPTTETNGKHFEKQSGVFRTVSQAVLLVPRLQAGGIAASWTWTACGWAAGQAPWPWPCPAPCPTPCQLRLTPRYPMHSFAIVRECTDLTLGRF